MGDILTSHTILFFVVVDLTPIISHCRAALGRKYPIMQVLIIAIYDQRHCHFFHINYGYHYDKVLGSDRPDHH